jgi:hypothetical protein
MATVVTTTTPQPSQHHRNTNNPLDLSGPIDKTKEEKGSGLDCANYTNERETCSFHFRPSVVDYQ